MTACPAATSSTDSARPTKPLAPITAIRIAPRCTKTTREGEFCHFCPDNLVRRTASGTPPETVPHMCTETRSVQARRHLAADRPVGRPRRDAHRTSTSRRSDQPLPQCLRHRGGRAATPPRRAAALRVSARRGSAIDALLVAMAEPGGTVPSGDVGDLRALAAYATDVEVHRA